MANKTFSSLSLLSLALGIFLVIAGINGLAGDKGMLAEFQQGLSKIFGNNDNRQLISTIIYVLELVAGIIMLLAPFGILQHGVLNVAVIIVCIFWLAKLILELFVYRAPLKNGLGQQDVLGWLQDFSLNLVILIAMWQVRNLDARS
jgi:ABC-type nickel/cobalt efflux system permease component RcnA